MKIVKKRKETIADLQRFGNEKELSNGLEIFKTNGVSEVRKYTESVCIKNITDSMHKDFLNIRQNKQAELVTGSFKDKEDYFDTIIKDEKIMKYVKTASDIGQEISKHQEIQAQKSRDFER